MKWLLRNISGVRFATTVDPETTPVMVITREDDFAGLRQDLYRGQDFGWWEYPGWGGVLPWEPVHWLTSRAAPVITESVVLWVRLDLFPDEPSSTETTDEIEDLEDALPPSDEGVEEDE